MTAHAALPFSIGQAVTFSPWILPVAHPSGSLEPSQADIAITDKVKKAAALMDIKLLDHLILTEDSYYSMADEGRM